jgi:hypothetical protein
MSKFLDKKEQVYDLKLSSYGHHLLSIGKFKPAYYAFFDDNIIYNEKYASVTGSTIEISETPNLQSQVLFEDIEKAQEKFSGEVYDQFSQMSTTIERNPRVDVYRYDNMIGDAHLDGEKDKAPAWKVVALQSMIDSTTTRDFTNNTFIPQVNITASYKKAIVEYAAVVDPTSVRYLNSRTARFVDGKVIELQSDDPLCYIEEVNTLLLTENFDIEIFAVSEGETSLAASKLEKKFFRKVVPQIRDGLLLSDREEVVSATEFTTGSVEYYFDVLTDIQVNQNLACKGALEFNKESYYVDIDFDCEKDKAEYTYYDIYGVATEPEICLD